MNFTDVVTWIAKDGTLTAKNHHCKNQLITSLEMEFEQWLRKPENQPACDLQLAGEINAIEFLEPVLEFLAPNSLHATWSSAAYQDDWYKEQLISNGCKVRYSLQLKPKPEIKYTEIKQIANTFTLDDLQIIKAALNNTDFIDIESNIIKDRIFVKMSSLIQELIN